MRKVLTIVDSGRTHGAALFALTIEDACVLALKRIEGGAIDERLDARVSGRPGLIDCPIVRRRAARHADERVTIATSTANANEPRISFGCRKKWRSKAGVLPAERGNRSIA
ncbi:hypothetical protein [Burkholderia thailandensis]|uniref:hypothetical protein n=1 Tax=Burkholderia thailandensis TaxID=57975 RepID=UPI001D10BD8A|nr:hypothetical protein [Burkholderia thailandensis]